MSVDTIERGELTHSYFHLTVRVCNCIITFLLAYGSNLHVS